MRTRLLPLLATLAVGGALLTGTGCNRDRKKVIAVIPKGQAHIFWQSVHAGANKAARENGVEVSWNGPATETDFNGQIKIVDSAISRRVDAIVLAPIDKKAMVGVVERASRENIPVVIFDSGIDTERIISQVATDNYKAGQVAADRMGEILNGQGKVAIVAVQPGAASTMAREQGFEDRIKEKFPRMQVVDKQYGMADFAQSLKKAENMLTAHPDLAGMFASNESSAVGAAQALKGRKGTAVKLVGFDWGPSLKEDLESGIIDSLVVQDPFRMGYESLLAAVHKLGNQPVTARNDIEPKLVRKTDLSDPAIQAQLNPDLKKYLN